MFALNQAEECLADARAGDATGPAVDDARRPIGQVRTSLEYRPPIELLDELPKEMERVQRACSAASDAIRGRYFPQRIRVAWVARRAGA